MHTRILTHRHASPTLPQAVISEGCFALKKFEYFSLCSRFKDMHSHHSSADGGEREPYKGGEWEKKESFFCISIVKHLIRPWSHGFGSEKGWGGLSREVAEDEEDVLQLCHSEKVVWVKRTWQRRMRSVSNHSWPCFPCCSNMAATLCLSSAASYSTETDVINSSNRECEWITVITVANFL